jgi:hypothetical protein
MGFFDDLGNALQGALNDFGNDPQNWYRLGRLAASEGNGRTMFGADSDPRLVRAYNQGYDDEIRERRSHR